MHHGFAGIGCEVKNIFIDWKHKDKTGLLCKKLKKIIESFKPDFVFSYGWWDVGINIEALLDILNEKGIFHAYWAYDDPGCFDCISLPVARRSGAVFTTAKEYIDEYKNRGIDAYLLLHACYKPQNNRVLFQRDFKHDIILLANNYNSYENPGIFKYRIHGINNVLKPLVENNFDIKVWGLWWTDWNRIYVLPGALYGGTVKKGKETPVYSSCKIALGFQSVGTSKTHFSVRTFEAMGFGAFHLSQYSPALENYFMKGVHMEWSKSADETLEIVKFYLKNDTARERIALKGQKEVEEKHTVAHRAKEVLDIVKNYI